MDPFFPFSTNPSLIGAPSPSGPNPPAGYHQPQPGNSWGGTWAGASGGATGSAQAEPPRCLNCWLSSTECYSLPGFSSCIPCSASGQGCSFTSPNAHLTPFPACSSFSPISSSPAPLQTTELTPPSFPAICAPESHVSLFMPTTTSHALAHVPQQLSARPNPMDTISTPAPAAPAQPEPEQPPRKKRRTTASQGGSGGSSSGSGRSRSTTASSTATGVAVVASRSPPQKRSFALMQQQQQPSPVAPSGIEAKVIGAEAIRALAAELLEESFRLVPEGWGMCRYLVYDIRSEFERVGRVMKRLGSATEALIAIRVALGATATMHPAIVPSSGRPDARVLLKGDLTVFGRERAPALRTLLDQAAKLVQDMGALEVPTYRNMCLLCELIIVFTRCDVLLSRQYIKIACEHWRKLNARKTTFHPSPSEADISFTVVHLDAVMTFLAGARGNPRLPELSDDEVAKATSPSRVPGPAFVKPDWYADMETPSWCDLPVTEIQDVIDASTIASFRMLAVLQSACAQTDGPRVPPATYQKVLDTILRQQPTLHRVRAKWTEPLGSDRADYWEGGEEEVTSTVTVPENQANRLFIYWFHNILQAKLPESSHLIAVNDKVASLVWEDLHNLSQFACRLRKEPPLCSSYWGLQACMLSGYLDHLPGGTAYLAQYVRDGPGKLEVRRFEAENIYFLLRSAAFFGPPYCERAKAAGDALHELDSKAEKAFPEDYRVSEHSV